MFTLIDLANDLYQVLLLFRLHALWGGQRKIVLGTFALYFFAYSCLIAAGVKSAIDLTRMSRLSRYGRYAH